jgi:hypothetical protein
MRYFSGLALRFVLGSAGVLLIYASMSYETEDGIIQSRLEEWWLRIDDLRQQAISRHLAFIKVIASVTTGVLDRLFGVRMFSVQSLGVSACYSVVCIGVAISLYLRFTPNHHTDIFDTLRMTLTALLYGSAPAWVNNDNWKMFGLKFIHFWFAGLLLMVMANFLDLGYIVLYGLVTPGLRMGAFVFVAIAFGVVFGVFLFTAFVGIMRATLRTITRSHSPIKIVALSLLNIAPLVTFYGLFELMFSMPVYPGDLGTVVVLSVVVLLFCGVLFNFAFVLSAVLFAVLAILMLLHRLFWPAIGRPLYKLQALGVAKRPRFFAAIGLTLIGAAFGKHEWLWFIMDKL